MDVGTDFIDLDAASKAGVKISNLAGVNSQSVAEHTWGLILSLSKKITVAYIGMQQDIYEYKYYLGRELNKKTIGIIGFGNIGSKVAHIAKAFDMKVLAYNRSDKKSNGVEFTSLENLLKNSDVIVVSLPLAKDTTNLLSNQEFDMMKQDVILVNPSREIIIDKEALLKNLANQKIFGFAMEADINAPCDKEFYKYPNVIITPHNAFFTKESESRVSEISIENVINFIKGNPQNLVN